MNIAWWISTIILVPLLAYELQFTAATLAFGRLLSDDSHGTGFQSAITPPREANVALIIYGLTLTLVGFSWYEFGIGRAVLSVAVIFVGVLVASRMLPSPESPHFRALIIGSMASRYANFVRDGDPIRADAMKMLLQKAGAYPEPLAAASASSGPSAAADQ